MSADVSKGAWAREWARASDLGCLVHAENQIDYARSGEEFTKNSRRVLREISQKLRRVIATERRRRTSR